MEIKQEMTWQEFFKKAWFYKKCIGKYFRVERLNFDPILYINQCSYLTDAINLHIFLSCDWITIVISIIY